MSFEFTIRVYWEDTDAGGIVFYANYLKYFERGRTEWLRSVGVVQSRLREDAGGMFVVTDTQLKYLQPARLDDELVISSEIASASSVTLVVQQQARLRSTRALLAEGSIRLAWVDATLLRPARIPSVVIQSLNHTT